MKVELARAQRPLPGSITIDSFGMLDISDSVGLPAVILRDGEVYVQGSLGNEVIYFQQPLYDATGKSLEKRIEMAY